VKLPAQRGDGSWEGESWTGAASNCHAKSVQTQTPSEHWSSGGAEQRRPQEELLQLPERFLAIPTAGQNASGTSFCSRALSLLLFIKLQLRAGRSTRQGARMRNPWSVGPLERQSRAAYFMIDSLHRGFPFGQGKVCRQRGWIDEQISSSTQNVYKMPLEVLLVVLKLL